MGHFGVDWWIFDDKQVPEIDATTGAKTSRFLVPRSSRRESYFWFCLTANPVIYMTP